MKIPHVNLWEGGLHYRTSTICEASQVLHGIGKNSQRCSLEFSSNQPPIFFLISKFCQNCRFGTFVSGNNEKNSGMVCIFLKINLTFAFVLSKSCYYSHENCLLSCTILTCNTGILRDCTSHVFAFLSQQSNQCFKTPGAEFKICPDIIYLFIWCQGYIVTVARQFSPSCLSRKIT